MSKSKTYNSSHTSCTKALNQGRYTWRHDSVLKSLYSQLKSLLVPSAIMYADIPGLRFDDSPQAIQYHPQSSSLL